MSTVIKVENISKRYRLGLKETRKDTLFAQLGHTLTAPIRNFRQLRSMTKFRQEDESVFWALKDINFEVQQGEVLGIIGHNGAGKSTLLKLLSRITEPTTGSITLKGRVAALLEVGTGFHQDLSGRENIYMNGTILGMTKKEIDRKLDEIVAFSGVEKHLDTPVKFYSSGMKVRLGFSVAAHLDPEILIIDEVLAVGDAEFQKKCIGKMESVAGSGRTVLFVSHNLLSVRQLCTEAILLNSGKIAFKGPTETIIKEYKNSLGSDNNRVIELIGKEFNNSNIKFKEMKIYPQGNFEITTNSKIIIEYLFFNCKENINLGSTIEIVNSDNIIIFHQGTAITQNKNSKKGTYKIKATIPPNLLNSDTYFVNIIIGENKKHILFKYQNIASFDIEYNSSESVMVSNRAPGVIIPKLTWDTSFVESC